MPTTNEPPVPTRSVCIFAQDGICAILGRDPHCGAALPHYDAPACHTVRTCHCAGGVQAKCIPCYRLGTLEMSDAAEANN